MSNLVKYAGAKGHVPVVKCGDGGLKYVDFDLLLLDDGGEYSETNCESEICMVILGGHCDVEAGGLRFENIGKRRNVFDGPATAVFIPPGVHFSVKAVASDAPFEAALLKSRSDAKGDPVLISPEDVNVFERGRDNWTRYVHDIVDARVPARTMLVGETFSPAGNWSSSPPHRHDNDNPPVETDHEEIYYFRSDPPQGWQAIRLYTDDRSLDEIYAVENHDTVIITQGYHPVASAAGYRGYYLWILAGRERRIIAYDDPQHAWLKDA